MDYKTYPVEMRLAGQTRTYSAEFQTKPDYADGWKRVLLMAHGKAEVRCCCPGTGARLLSIHSRAASDRFHLARYPETGSEHAEDCIYYGVDPSMSGMGSYRRGVIQELDDGNVKVKLRVGLQQRPTSAPEEIDKSPASKVAAARPRSGQTAMTLLGLLHYLWTKAGLNTWSPAMTGKRSLGVVHYHLMRAAQATIVGRQRLAHNLLVSTPTPDGQQAKHNAAKALEAVTHRRRLVVVAPLAAHKDGSDSGPQLPVAHFHGIPHLSVDEEIWKSLQRRFLSEMNAWASGNPVVVVAQTEPPKAAGGSMRAQVVDASLMHVTKDWIPVDSGFEHLVADQLVAQRRRFEKPMKFDAGIDAVFPDFWLKDLGTPIPMEVWGMGTSEYLARKADKAAHYDRTYGKGAWWSWNAYADEILPEFPAMQMWG